MKKFIAAVLCAGFVALSAAGCGYSDALDSTSKTTEASVTDGSTEPVTEEPTVSASSYNNNLEGLHNYFVDLGYIQKDASAADMDASLIGAAQGKKYAAGGSVTIELYEYDTDNLNDKANEIIASVKENGEFTILGLSPVKAYLSGNGKYLMIYSDTSIDDEKPDTSSSAYIARENAIKDFSLFHN